MHFSDRQHGSRAGGNLHMCVGGDGLQQSPGTVPATAGEQGGGPLIRPTGLALSHGCSDQEFVLLVQKQDMNTMVIRHTSKCL